MSLVMFLSEPIVARVVRAGRVGLLALALSAGAAAPMWGVSVATADQATADEDQVKAAFLFNFARFVEWPPPSTGPLVIGVVSDDAFAKTLERLVRDRTVDQRPVVMRRLRAGDDPATCHVLYIAGSPRERAAEILRRCSGPILTVGDTVQFLRDGGIIRFHTEDKRVRFQINRDNATAAGLKISSHLLKLASQ